MSEALDYLLKVRPEAMAHYFAFLKSSGGHLDAKTRALISVITKVSAQTEKGFRQYVLRALRAGASADEILDALLTAFPALGLTRIVWAVDQLLALDLPEFAATALGTTAGWHAVATLAELKPGTTRLACAGRELFVYRDGDDIRAWDSRCPHQGTNMPALAQAGNRLRCPGHGWEFDLATGACVAVGDRPLAHLEARVEAGTLQVWW
ncbi:MAG: Rieske 2Fe-2S domain-containing protein [Gammaproteobacteria bacterium]|nr:Rieske 2Fe-2S domain-containing protein [Gammaproteobacteria bacterium]